MFLLHALVVHNLPPTVKRQSRQLAMSAKVDDLELRNPRWSPRLTRLAQVSWSLFGQSSHTRTAITAQRERIISSMISVRMLWWTTTSRTFDTLGNDTGYFVSHNLFFSDIRCCRGRSSSPFRDYADRNLGSASLRMLGLL